MAGTVYSPLPSGVSLFGVIPPTNPSLVSTFGYLTFGLPVSNIITNHVAIALDLLVEQFEEKTNLQETVRILAERYQNLEYEESDLIDAFQLDIASGIQLDIVGGLVGEPRGGKTDSEYRNAIIIQIQINRGSGTPDSIILGAKTIANSDPSLFRYKENRPATINIALAGINLTSNIYSEIKSLTPVGVALEISQVEPTLTAFEFTENGIVYGGKGFDDGPLGSGVLAEKLL